VAHPASSSAAPASRTARCGRPGNRWRSLGAFFRLPSPPCYRSAGRSGFPAHRDCVILIVSPGFRFLSSPRVQSDVLVAQQARGQDLGEVSAGNRKRRSISSDTTPGNSCRPKEIEEIRPTVTPAPLTGARIFSPPTLSNGLSADRWNRTRNWPGWPLSTTETSGPARPARRTRRQNLKCSFLHPSLPLRI